MEAYIELRPHSDKMLAIHRVTQFWLVDALNEATLLGTLTQKDGGWMLSGIAGTNKNKWFSDFAEVDRYVAEKVAQGNWSLAG